MLATAVVNIGGGVTGKKRLVFEIEYVDQLFDEYRPIELKIWRTFTDTSIEELYSKS